MKAFAPGTATETEKEQRFERCRGAEISSWKSEASSAKSFYWSSSNRVRNGSWNRRFGFCFLQPTIQRTLSLELETTYNSSQFLCVCLHWIRARHFLCISGPLVINQSIIPVFFFFFFGFLIKFTINVKKEIKWNYCFIFCTILIFFLSITCYVNADYTDRLILKKKITWTSANLVINARSCTYI